MRFSIAAACSAALVTSLAPTLAHAYCRTITQPLPASYDPQAGCYEPSDAIFLWWKSPCVGFSVVRSASTQVTYQAAVDAMTRAFGRWRDATCAGGGNPTIKAEDNGAVDCDTVEYSEQGPNQHAIIFRDDSWPHSDPNNTLALTTVTFDKNTGELYDADMEINTAGNKVVVNGNAGPGEFDFDSIVTHEAGHFLGLAHSADTKAVMYAHYKPGSTALTSDDVDGICAIYAPDGTRATMQKQGSTVVAVNESAGACDPTPRHDFGTQCGPIGTPAQSSSNGCTISTAAIGAGSSGAGVLVLGVLGAALGIGRRAGARLRGMELGSKTGRRARAVAAASLLALGAGAVTTFVHEPVAHASVSIAVLFDELVRESSAASVVTPVEQTAVWENGRIYTYTRVHVDRLVAGKVDGDGQTIWVRTMGGTVGHIGQIVDGEANLEIGKSSLVFVQPVADEGRGVYVVTARAQGQFPVVIDPVTKASRLQRAYAVGALMAPPPDRIAKAAQQRVIAGAGSDAPLAADVLHKRPVDDAAREIAAAWGRTHAAK